MKKLLAVLVALTMIMSFAACGGSGSNTGKDFDAKKASEALLASAEFKDCALVDAEQTELEYDITLEDTTEFYFAKVSSGTSANMFIIAVAKDGQSSLMCGEMEKIEKTYVSSWVDSTYQERLAEAPKVNDRYVSEKDGMYICIISSDNDACLELIGLK